MNRQAIFNKVAAHLFVQGQQSRIDSGYCCYQHPDNPLLRCAIGCLMPSDGPLGFIGSVNRLAICHPGFLKGLGANTSYDLQFLRNLQRVHDSHPPRSWAQSLCKFAHKYNLSLPRIFKP